MASQMYQAKEQGTAYQGDEGDEYDDDDESMEEEDSISNQYENQQMHG